MSFNIAKEKKDYIVDTYGTNVDTINKIIRIVNNLDLPFYDEDDFIVTIEIIVSKLETENFEKEIGKVADCRACYTLKTAILSTLKRKFSDDYLYDNSVIKRVLSLK